MECNKDEAIRAKEVAEKKMQNNDFEGAQRIAMKAQQLFPALDNISQLLEVCHVHICAGRKINGTEMDCYGILQVEKQADEITIKKHYRRLALILHPDKNKFPGAETAFKMIGEAHRVLSDKGNRSLYDSKCSRLSVRTIPTKSNPPYQTNVIPPHALQAFWTKCPFCNTRFRYVMNVMNKALSCQSCSKRFIAYELEAHSIPHLYEKVQGMVPRTFPVFQNGSARISTHANGASAPERATQVGGRYMGDKEKTDHMKGSARTSTDSKEASAPKRATQVGGDMRDIEKVDHMKSERKAEASVTQTKKRKRNSEDSSEEGCKSKSPVNMRKSARLNKTSHNETCNGTLGEDTKDNSLDDVSSKEKFMPQNEISSSFPGRSTEVQQDKEACDEGTSMGNDASVAMNSKIIQDPEFYNFDKDREKKCFHINQLWACYGEEDKMPRFYVVIRKVFSSEFRLRITWLEPLLEGQMKKINLSTDLPISSGKFKLGNTKETTDISTFSHLVHFEKGSNRGSYLIYPKKGETWALFKNRKMNLSSELKIVEIVSNHVVGVGIEVASLGKIEGFFSLFKRKPKENGSFIFQISDLLDFSHRIPSYKLTGNERQGVPKGCFELDPAALPNDVEYCELELNGLFSNSEKLQQPWKNQQNFSRKVNSTDNKQIKTEEHIVRNMKEKNFVDLTASSGSSKKENVSFVSPAGKILQEFYNFAAEKSEINFLPDQIWAMYDNDGLPMKYAQIKKIQSSPFRLYVLMLEAQMPCAFKISAGKPKPFAPSAFSHIVKAEIFGNNRINIYPKAGQVWALDKTWDDTFQSSNLKNRKYEIAEVLESDNEQFVRISLLLHLKGSKTVFKGARGRSMSSCIMDVPWKEVDRFSYQIPSYKFTTERNGLLRGCWELDPAAIPKNLLPLE